MALHASKAACLRSHRHAACRSGREREREREWERERERERRGEGL
jgi:hypothetical protein